jgi:hypothetical protein
MKQNSSSIPIRFEIDGDIILGRRNLDLFKNKIKNNHLDHLLDETFIYPIIPIPILTFQQFLQDSDYDFDFDSIFNGPKFNVEFVSIHRPLNQQLDSNNPIDVATANTEILAFPIGVTQVDYNISRGKAQHEHDYKVNSRKSEFRSLSSSYDNKLAVYKSDQYKFETKKNKFQEKVTKFNQILSEFFSDDIIELLQQDILN